MAAFAVGGATTGGVSGGGAGGGGASARPSSAAGGSASARPPHGSASLERQVAQVARLLELKGEEAAAEIRQRVKTGDGVVVKGISFDARVLSLALERWSRSAGRATVAAAAAPKEAAPHAIEEAAWATTAGCGGACEEEEEEGVEGGKEGGQASSGAVSPGGPRSSTSDSIAGVHGGEGARTPRAALSSPSAPRPLERQASALSRRGAGPSSPGGSALGRRLLKRGEPPRTSRSAGGGTGSAPAAGRRAVPSQTVDGSFGQRGRPLPGVVSPPLGSDGVPSSAPSQPSEPSAKRARLGSRPVAASGSIWRRPAGSNRKLLPVSRTSAAAQEASFAAEPDRFMDVDSQEEDKTEEAGSVAQAIESVRAAENRFAQLASPSDESGVQAGAAAVSAVDASFPSLRDRLQRRKNAARRLAMPDVPTPCRSSSGSPVGEPTPSAPRPSPLSSALRKRSLFKPVPAEAEEASTSPHGSTPTFSATSQQETAEHQVLGKLQLGATIETANARVAKLNRCVSQAGKSGPNNASPKSAPDVTQVPKVCTTQPSEINVKEMKEQLSSHGVNFSGCVEKSELRDLLARFKNMSQRPLADLQAEFAAAFPSDTLPLSSEAAAARLLSAGSEPPQCSAMEASGQRPANPQPQRPHGASPGLGGGAPRRSEQRAGAGGAASRSAPESVPAGCSERERDAADEAKRIQSIRRERYDSASSWGFAVLGVQEPEIAAVQKAYRTSMRKLHPDRAQQDASASEAIDALKEAKEACERCLSKQSPPGVPRKLGFTSLCTVPGQRRYQLHWTSPEKREFADVRKWVVAAFDPAYGRPLNISTIEPDYNGGRFQTIDELGKWEVSEEDLHKMPMLWNQNVATFHVAAANEAGQSSWATVKIPLSAVPATTSPPLRVVSSVEGNEELRQEVRILAEQIKGRPDKIQFGTLLEKQRKPVLVEYLRGLNLPSDGTKCTLILRLMTWRAKYMR